MSGKTDGVKLEASTMCNMAMMAARRTLKHLMLATCYPITRPAV